MINKVNQVRDLAQEERFEDALRLIAEIEKDTELTPNLLVLKGALIQMTEDSHYDLEDSEKAFRAAMDIDDEYVEALNELGYLCLAGKDNAAEAKPLFEKALDVCEAQMTESVLGLAECLVELEGAESALRFLKDVRRSPMDMEKIEELEQEIRARQAKRS